MSNGAGRADRGNAAAHGDRFWPVSILFLFWPGRHVRTYVPFRQSREPGARSGLGLPFVLCF